MNARRNTLLAWLLVGLVVVADLVTAVDILSRGSSAGWDIIPVTLVSALVGALIISRQPRNVIGLLLLLPSAALALGVPIVASLEAMPTAPEWPALLLLGALWFSGWNWLLLVMPILFILLLFPTGQPPSRHWRWLILVGLGLSAAFILMVTFLRELGPLEDQWVVPNPIGFLELAWVEERFIPVWFVLLPLFTLLCAASPLVRFRRAGTVEREQMKWLFYAGAFFAVPYAASFISDQFSENALSNLLFGIGILAIPVAIGIAILRYNLYDIDVIIRRTLVYGLLTGVLVGVYFGVVLLAQSAFVALTGQENPLAIVISTLVIAALFNPLRQRLQDFIDRRFYRRKYDAEQILARFAQTARDEVDLEALQVELVKVVQETMQPEQMTLWLKSGKQIR